MRLKMWFCGEASGESGAGTLKETKVQGKQTAKFCCSLIYLSAVATGQGRLGMRRECSLNGKSAHAIYT